MGAVVYRGVSDTGARSAGGMWVVNEQWTIGSRSAVQRIDGSVSLWASGDSGNWAVEHFWPAVSYQDALYLDDLLRHPRNRD
jgi:hypothetical protein